MLDPRALDAARAFEANSQAYMIACAEALGGQVLRESDATLTVLPYAHWANGVVSPRFAPERAEHRLDQIFATFRALRLPMKMRLGPSTQPENLAELLDRRGFAHPWCMPYMACELAAFKPVSGLRRPAGLTIAPVEDYGSVLSRHHPFLGTLSGPRRQRLLAEYQNLARRKPRDHWMFIAELQGHTVGSAVLFFHQDSVSGGFFVVEKACRRQGIGAAMMQSMWDFCLDRGARMAVMAASGQGTRFYPQFGFRGVGRYATYHYSATLQRRDQQQGAATALRSPPAGT